MTYYLLQAAGDLAGSFPWSINAFGESSSSEATVANSWDGSFRAIWSNETLAPYIPTTVTITSTSASTASATFKQTTKTTTSSSTAGTSTSPALPYHTCEIVTLRSSLAKRSGRGRWYLPPFATNALAADGFSILAAAQDALEGALTTFFSAISPTITLGVKHLKASEDGTTTAYSMSQIVACDIPNTFAVQRRRADKLVPTRVSVSV
jgi:hypothetical protein